MLSDSQNYKLVRGPHEDLLDPGPGGHHHHHPVPHTHVLAGPPGAGVGLHLDAAAAAAGGAQFEPVAIDPFQVDYSSQLVPPSMDSPNFSVDYHTQQQQQQPQHHQQVCLAGCALSGWLFVALPPSWEKGTE